MKVVLEKRTASSILNLEDEFKMRYSLSFNLRGRSSRKQKNPPLDKVGEDENASVKNSSAQKSYRKNGIFVLFGLVFLIWKMMGSTL